MKKNLKKIVSLCVCFVMVSSFFLVTFADTCESSATITSSTKSCTGNTCNKYGNYSPYYRILDRGYYQCWDSYGTPYTKPYSHEYNSGCC